MSTIAAIRQVIAARANRAVRVFASLLMVGGLIGVGSSAVLAYRAAPLRPLIAVDAAAFIALYALQIPSLEVHGLKYDYFTGVAILVLHNPGGSPVALDFGADMALMFDGDSGGFVLGMNVIAIAACVVIAMSGRRKLWMHS